MVSSGVPRLLGPVEIRRAAAELGIRPTKQLGQNFLHDPNTIRRIVAISGVTAGEAVVEIGPGLGSLTLGLLDAGAVVTAIELDPLLAGALGDTVASHQPDSSSRLTVIAADAMAVRELPSSPARLVANLPYNVSVPVLLHFLAAFPSIQAGLVMVQAEVAQRLCAPPGSRVYGVPSAKAAWDAELALAGPVPRAVFWPVPNVDSLLVSFTRRVPTREGSRADTFAVIDAAFSQRRKTLRSCLAGWAGSPSEAERVLREAGIDPGLRGEALSVEEFARIATTRDSRRG